MENLEEQIIESPETAPAEEIIPEQGQEQGNLEAAPETEKAAPSEAPEEDEVKEQENTPGPAQSLEERIAALEEALARQTEQYMQREQDLALRQHFSSLEKQAEELRESFPDFDLMAALEDPMFVKLTSPEVGLPVNVAYFAVNYRQLNEANARAAAEKLGNSLQAGRNMPGENGSIQRAAPDGSYRPLAELSPDERKLRMDMIRSGKLRFD